MNGLTSLGLLFILCVSMSVGVVTVVDVLVVVVVGNEDAYATSHDDNQTDAAEDNEDNIVMIVPQSEYYFLVDQNAIISLDIENSYGYSVNGLLQSTVTQTIGQFSTTRTQSSSLTLVNGTQTISLDFGTSDTPSSFVLDLGYTTDDIHVSLDSIVVNFVSDESEQNNTQNPTQSSSSQSNNNQAGSQSSQQSAQQQMQQNQINQEEANNPSDTQQRLQNSQLPQDTSALKQELQQHVQEENHLREQFEGALVSNEDFQEIHNSILAQGNGVTNATLNPTSEHTGTFEVNYQDQQQQQWTKFQGSMVNGTLTDIKQTSQLQNDLLLERLESDKRFQEYEESLTLDGFVREGVEFSYPNDGDGTTTLSLQYNNKNQDDATITAIFDEGDNLVGIELERPFDYLSLFVVFAVILCGVVGYMLYRRFYTNKTTTTTSSPPDAVSYKDHKEFDYITASSNLITQAKIDFDNQQYKDAYSKIAQSIRLYLSYELGLKKEITNEDILSHLDGATNPVEQIAECFKRSSLVEFAKSPVDKTEFDKMIALATKLVTQKTDTSS